MVETTFIWHVEVCNLHLKHNLLQKHCFGTPNLSQGSEMKYLKIKYGTKKE